MSNLKDKISREIQMALSLLNAGQLDKAVKRAKAASRKFPQEPSFPKIVGLASAEQGKSNVARTYFERAWKLNKTQPDLIQNYALSLITLNQPKEAKKILETLAPDARQAPNILFLNALATFKTRDDKKALQSLEELLSLHPDHVEARVLKSDVLLELRDPRAALTDLEYVLSQIPDHHDAQLRMAKILADLGKWEQALAATKKALALKPDHAETLRVFSVLPNISDSILRDVGGQIRKRLNSADGEQSEDHAILQSAAANIARRVGDTKEEMALLEKAHATWRLSKSASGKFVKFNKMAVPYLEISEAQNNRNSSQLVPIFIVGLPRSGTTLVEQILGSHSRVQSMGELTLAMRWHKWHGPNVPPSDAADAFAEYFWNQLPSVERTASTIVDKMPGNYRYLGLILRAIPQAVVLNVTRDPRDVGLSMWRAFFSAEGMMYSHHWATMANEVNYYRRCMQIWKKMFPDRIHEISYEALVTGKTEQIPRISEVCGLSFEPAMLEPHNAPSNVRTASQVQVRQAVNSKSIGNWKAHKNVLRSFITDLDIDLWPELWTED